MAKTLVLAEKPSVGKEIARVLGCRRALDGGLEGERYVVTWALGHLVELAPPEDYDKTWTKWDLLTLPMLPEQMKTVVIRESSRQFRAVQALMRRGDVSELVIATDSGREGELVARWIMEKAGWKKPAKRLWISSQTDKAIREGFQNLRPAQAYDDLYHSARARSEADWLVGLNVTRALTCKYGAQLSAGRVQTPTLALIVDREEEIRRFVPKEFYTLQVKCQGFSAIWRDKNGQARTFDRAQAERLAAALGGKTGVLTEVRRAYRQTPPPAAYDLTELQRDANKKYAYSAKETLSLMQSLYERHKLLTYPRTDSRYISDDVTATLPERLKSVMVDEYRDLARAILMKRPLQTRFLVNNAKVTDHHAILPTEEQPDLYRLTGPERNIYDLVVRRFLAVLLPPCEYEETKLTLTVDGQTFTARGKIRKEPGWRQAYSRFTLEEDEETDEDEREQSLPAIRQGDRVQILSARVNTGRTSPPKRYTEDTLLSAMERAGAEDMPEDAERQGLGTPATRASILEKLVQMGFVERRGKQLFPTKDGHNLACVLPEVLTSPQLTAQWETELTAIAKGQADPEGFMAGIAEMTRGLIANYSQISEDAQKLFQAERVLIGKCPRCGESVYEGKKNYYCGNRSCQFVMWKNDRFFEERGKAFTPKIAAALLKDGKAKVKGLRSLKTGKTYDGTVLLADTGGKYVNYRVEQRGKN